MHLINIGKRTFAPAPDTAAQSIALRELKKMCRLVGELDVMPVHEGLTADMQQVGWFT